MIRRVFLIALVVGAAVWFYDWIPSEFPREFHSAESVQPYQELTAALLSGRLSLLRTPDPRLAGLSNPYDPGLNAPYRVNDLSYFKGKYYVYHGIAPALAVFAPVRLIFGRHLSDRLAVVILCAGGFAASLWILFALRRRHFPESPALVFLSAILALALADGYQVVIRGVIANHVAIAGAYFFSMLALAAWTQAAASRNSWRWIALGSLGFGFAVGSRPNFAVSTGVLILFLLAGLRSRRVNLAGSRRVLALAAILPWIAAIIGILSYNALRFGQPFEFGARYMLGGWNQTSLASAGLGHFWINTWTYLFAPARFSPHFPFVAAANELAVGVLGINPWLWTAPIAAFALLRRSGNDSARNLGFSAFLLGLFNLLSLVALPSGNPAAAPSSANSRYVFDFLPYFALFVSIGAVAAGSLLVKSSMQRLSLAAALLLVSVASALAAVSMDLHQFPPSSYLWLSRVLDRPTVIIERWRGLSYGPLALEVTFPGGQGGETDPLVDTGQPNQSDLVYVRYTGISQACFGLVSDGVGGPVGPPVAVDFSIPHRLEIWMGSLFPPAGHPAWPKSGELAMMLQRRARVLLDGRTVLDDVICCHPATPRQVWVGESPVSSGYTRERFHGVVWQQRRLPIAVSTEDGKPPMIGDLRIRLKLPQGRTGAREPLVVTGVPTAGDLVYLVYIGADQVQVGLDHWGHLGLQSRPFKVDYSAPHIVDVTLSSLHPKTLESDGLARIIFDGKTVISANSPAYDSSPDAVAIGRNPIGGSTCDYAFTGTIIEVSPLPSPP